MTHLLPSLPVAHHHPHAAVSPCAHPADLPLPRHVPPSPDSQSSSGHYSPPAFAPARRPSITPSPSPPAIRHLAPHAVASPSAPSSARRNSITDLPCISPQTSRANIRRRASAHGYHCKYDPNEVLALRDFFVSLQEDAQLREKQFSLNLTLEEKIKAEELQRKKDSSHWMAVSIFKRSLSKDCSTTKFLDMLSVIYPNANKRDVHSMLQLTFPDEDADAAAAAWASGQQRLPPLAPSESSDSASLSSMQSWRADTPRHGPAQALEHELTVTSTSDAFGGCQLLSVSPSLECFAFPKQVPAT